MKMKTLVYDDSFEGVLTAVFEVFEYKFKEAIIISKRHFVSDNLFDDSYFVISNEEKSDRVLKKVKENLGNEGVSCLLKLYLSERKEVGNLILNLIKHSLKHPKENVLKDYGSESIMEIFKIQKMVGRESHRMKAFVRFEQLKDGFFFAKIAPDFNVLPLIIRHFSERYKDQKWIIYDEHRGYGVWYDLNEASLFYPDETFIQNLKKQSMFYDEKEEKFQILWKSYFSKTNIIERKNPKKHLQDLPRRYWKYLTEKK